MSQILIADSGSTKTDWALIEEGKIAQRICTTGINPYFVSEQQGAAILADELKLERELHELTHIYMYSAGAKAPANKKMLENILKGHFAGTDVSVACDMTGAARSTCHTEKGVVAILGTGSNSCYYDGSKIQKQRASLGYVLGDEGSGTFLGKKVLRYFFYDTFDGDLHEAFVNKYGNNLPEVLDSVYKQPFPNRYLASFTEFLGEHRGHFMIENILEDSFLAFFNANLLKYRESWKYPIHFVGSVAYTFRDVLHNIAEQFGLNIGNIVKSPMDGLVAFHAPATVDV